MANKKVLNIKYKIIPLTDPRNPVISVTYFKKKRKYELFSEKVGRSFGFYIKREMIALGFSKKQLSIVKEHGTQNFI